MIIIISIIILQFVLIEGLIILNAGMKSQKKGDYLIILGAGVNGSTPSRSLNNRLYKALEYLNSHPEIKVVLSGGQGKGEDISEAEAMRQYLLKHGIKESSMIIEDRSTSTFENIKYTKEILHDIDGRDNIELLIVTGGFHIFRSLFLARRQGFEAFGVPAKTPRTVLLKCYLREYFAVIKSFIVDR